MVERVGSYRRSSESIEPKWSNIHTYRARNQGPERKGKEKKYNGLKLRPERKLGYIIVQEPVCKGKTRECCGRERHGTVGREPPPSQ